MPGLRTGTRAMTVTQVSLNNFRNYSTVQVALNAGKTILLGENAQGKSNFLEAIEIASNARSSRATHDSDLILWGQDYMSLELSFLRQGEAETVSMRIASQPGRALLSRQVKVNGVSYGQSKALLGHLVAVSFQSQDLNLLRGGPKSRRDWIDQVILRLRPAFHDVVSSYQKVIAQRNRLLKNLCERGRLTVSDQEQLLVWDKQLARFGARIIRERLNLIAELLPVAQQHQSFLSGRKELLQADYFFKAPEPRQDQHGEPAEYGEDIPTDQSSQQPQSVNDLLQAEEAEVALMLLRLLKERRGEELARKQSLIGPHRDDIVLRLNNASAVSFASQGQQRSLVLSLKLAELERLTEALDETPVLILDDVMAELDASRQRLLLSVVGSAAQTLITTTHLSGFDSSWLEDATIYQVASGAISPVSQ